MALSPLTLAALATSAVPYLHVRGYRQLDRDHPHEMNVVLETDRGVVLVQLPTSPVAEVHHSAKRMGQAALTDGVRAELPFEAPRVLGITRSGDTRAIVSTFVPGDRFDVEELDAGHSLIDALAAATASIHTLPMSVVTSQGLSNRSASQVRSDAARIVDRAYASGLMPEVVKTYWDRTLGDHSIWDFHPTVVHGSMSDETVLVEGARVVSVLDWAELSVGDPAADLAWLVGARSGTLEAVLDRYCAAQPLNARDTLDRRARFWHELEIGRWLLHGIQQHDQSIIDDAVDLFDRLVARASQALATGDEVRPRMSPEDALEHVPSEVRDLHETNRLDALDDDRVFETDDDFGPTPDDGSASADRDATKPIEPLDAEAPFDDER